MIAATGAAKPGPAGSDSAGSRPASEALDPGAASAGAVCAIIVAGGSGTRFGNPEGKQMVELAGRPMLSWTVAAFDQAATIGHIVVVCPDERRDAMRERAVEPYGFATPVTFASAGATRQDSTRSGIAAAPAGFRFVAIHDGARPLITPQVIDAAATTLISHDDLDGVVCGQPAIDTLKIADADGTIEDTPDRNRFWCVQTPQIFSIAMLERAFAVADAEDFVGTDDASLVERAGGVVRCMACPRDNMKVTVPEDLVPVEAILRYRLQAQA